MEVDLGVKNGCPGEPAEPILWPEEQRPVSVCRTRGKIAPEVQHPQLGRGTAY